MNYNTLKQAVLAVKENIRMNGGSWQTWTDAHHILSTYELESDPEVAAILDRAIKSDGASLSADCCAAQIREHGQEFIPAWY